jgi:hypothetical protein
VENHRRVLARRCGAVVDSREEAGPSDWEGTELILQPECPTIGMTELALIIGYCIGCCAPREWTVEVVGTVSKGCSLAQRSMHDDFRPWGGNRCWG